jgi:hypothetical protein
MFFTSPLLGWNIPLRVSVQVVKIEVLH